MSTVIMTKVTAESAAPESGDFFSEYYPLLYRTAYGVLGNAEDAEDVVQTILLRLLRKEILLDERQNPKGYLYRTAVNLALEVIRARRRFVGTEGLEAIATADSSSHHDEQLHRKLYEAIAELKPKAAEILILRYVHNYSDVQIAKLLSTSRGTIAVNLYRSRARLKKLLRAALGDES
jgi:RNA polymerase sigma-70 factor (ECF subfamily)